MKIHIQYQNQFGNWLHYTTKHNEADAFRVGVRRASAIKKRHRLVDDDGNLLDIITP